MQKIATASLFSRRPLRCCSFTSVATAKRLLPNQQTNSNSNTNPDMTSQLTLQLQEKQRQVEQQGALVRQLKAQPQPQQDRIKQEVERLVAGKAELQHLEAQLAKLAVVQDLPKKFDRAALEDLLRKRFYYAPSFGIYGGVSGLYDYGPPGCALQSNILETWRKHFVLEEDMLELDCSILTPHDVLKTSGHVDRFSDLMCKDLANGEIFRVDHLVEGELERRLEQHQIAVSSAGSAAAPSSKKGKEVAPVKLSDEEKAEYESILAQIDGYNADQLSAIIQKYKIMSPNGNPVSEPEVFNLMFGTPIGPTGVLKGYLRPETAQGQFLNFKKLLEFNTERMPFASAQIGRSFRNEISPRSGLLRVREFTMAEIEHFVHPEKKEHARFEEVKDLVLNLLPAEVQMEGSNKVVPMKIGEAVQKGLVNNETLGYFLARIHLFLKRIGIKSDKLRFRQHLKNEMAHYACDCWDAEIQCSYGWIECVGCADRSAFDLTRHTERTKERLVARETLKEPMIVEKSQLNFNRKLFGMTFKKQAKAVETHLVALSEENKQALGKDLVAKGKVVIKVEEEGGAEFEITSDLLKVDRVTEKVHVLEYTPNVIEPSFGIGRILYCLLEHSWWIRDGDENRHVLSFPPSIAPVKCLLVPISANDQFTSHLQNLGRTFRKMGISTKIDDSASSIGKRYSRNDELGTPFAITIDFQTLQDGTVTLRDRDSTKQIREKAEVVVALVQELVEETTQWEQVVQRYPEFVQQNLA